MATTDKKELELYGQDPTHQNLKDGYNTSDDYKKQGDTRVVKALMMPVHVKSASPMFPGAEVMQERTLVRNQKVTVQELGLIALEKGERHGWFYTDAELAAGLNQGGIRPVQVSSEELDVGGGIPEMGPHELVLWLQGNEGHTPTVQEVLDTVGSDKDLAKRMIDAENARDPDDPRVTLVTALTRVAESND